MITMAGRLSRENSEWVRDYLEWCGATQGKMLNEWATICREIMQQRRVAGDTLFQGLPLSEVVKKLPGETKNCGQQSGAEESKGVGEASHQQ